MKVVKGNENIFWSNVGCGDVLKIKQHGSSIEEDVILIDASNNILADLDMIDSINLQLIYVIDYAEVRCINIDDYEILRIYKNAVLKLEGD